MRTQSPHGHEDLHPPHSTQLPGTRVVTVDKDCVTNAKEADMRKTEPIPAGGMGGTVVKVKSHRRRRKRKGTQGGKTGMEKEREETGVG